MIDCSSGTRHCRIPVTLAAFLGLLHAATSLAAPLPPLNIDLQQTSVSGISSGGYMAVQFGVAHAAMVSGVGVIAGGPYRCAAHGIGDALETCMQGSPDPDRSVAETEGALLAGRIDHPGFMSRQRIWLFSGYNDGVVKRPVVDSLYRYYRNYTRDQRIFYQDGLAAGHAMVTELQGNECSLTGADYLNDCDYDAAGLLLQHIYGRLVGPSDSDAPTGEIIEFDQSGYVQGPLQESSMARLGYLYLPGSCARGERCRIHVVFHGCRQYAEEVGDAFYRNAGYNRWADKNRIVLLYPQTRASNLRPFNPKGCWDWWGYTGPDFAYRDGIQISAIRRMVEALSRNTSGTDPAATDRVNFLATDATDRTVALAWNSIAGATAYRIHRAGNGAGAFQPIATLPADQLSFVDRGLAAESRYRYRLGVFMESGVEIPSDPTLIETRRSPPECDPYFNDNVTHVARARATVWFGLVFARGSWDYMGLWNIVSETALYRADNGFKVGICP